MEFLIANCKCLWLSHYRGLVHTVVLIAETRVIDDVELLRRS